MTREICLNWNNHASVFNSFKNFLSKEEMVDVTLACEGKSLKAHKLILSACSPFFQSLLSENPCKHPIVILTHVKYKELQAVIDFMYDGEINVREEHLTSLIKVAEALKVKVLGDVTIAAHENEFHVGDESEYHAGDESESNSSDESKPQSNAVSPVQSDDESEWESAADAAPSPVQSDDESELQSGAASRIQSEDESESQTSTVSKFQTTDELESSSIHTFKHKPAALTITYSPRRGRPVKQSRSCLSGTSESEKEQLNSGTEVLFGDTELNVPNLNDSTESIKPPTLSPRKSPKKQPDEENLEGSMPILEEQMSVDEEVSINFQLSYTFFGNKVGYYYFFIH